MTTSLDMGALAEASAARREANRAFSASHPGESPGRQPVHTVYGGAQLFAADTVPKLGQIALRAMDEYAPDPRALAEAIGLPLSDDRDIRLAQAVHQRVRDKLQRDAVEDYRIDYEDGYGVRP